MRKQDEQLLAEAYLSVSKKMSTVPSDKEASGTEPNDVVGVGSMDEPAPGVDMNMINSEVEDVNPEDKDTTGIPVTMVADTAACSVCGSSECECDEAHDMALDNLNSIRDSIMKIADYCGSGEHLEAWVQQKLAIAMDNLASVARSLR
jgi:hypothetical protein